MLVLIAGLDIKKVERTFSGNNEGCRVGAEVEEELGDDIACQ